MTTKLRTYSELIKLESFDERFEYLKLSASVGDETFGFDRYVNQAFYHSSEWKRIRNIVIARDLACDLGIEGREIYDRVYVHHMNPINKEDILDATEYLLNPEYLICTSKLTHDAIHFGDKNILASDPIERRKNDTCPWRD